MCSDDPLLFTCTVTRSQTDHVTIVLPSGEDLTITREFCNTRETLNVSSGVRLTCDIPENNAYLIMLVIDKASLLSGTVTCNTEYVPTQANVTANATCLILTGI